MLSFMFRPWLSLAISVALFGVSPGSLAAADDKEQLAEALFSNPSFVNARLSPTGRHLASISHYKGKRSLIVLDLETSEMKGVTVGPGEDVNRFHWIDADNIVYTVSKWELYTRGVSVYSVEDNRARKILDPQQSGLIFADLVDPLIHIDDEFVFSAVRIHGQLAPNLYRMNVVSGSRTRLAQNTGEISHYVVDLDGQPLFGIESRGRMGVVLKRDKAGKWVRVEGIEEKFTPLGMLPDNRFLLTAVKNAKGFNGANILDLETGQFAEKPRYYPGYDLVAANASSPIIDNLNGYLIGLRFNHEKPDNFWFDSGPRTVEDKLEESFPGHLFEFLGYNPSAKLIYFTVSKDTLPPVIIQFELATGKIDLVYRQFPRAQELDFRPMQPVSFSHPDSPWPIHGYLTLPEGPGPYPTVLLLHGGPQVRDQWGFDPTVQFLALNGYAVFQINYRGSSGYGRKFGLRTLAKTAEKSVEDVIAGARWLIEGGIADPERIGLMGGSFGGYISVEAAAREPGLWRAVIGFGGVYDLNALYKQDNRRGYNWVDDLFVGYDEELYASLSPVNHAHLVKSPVLLIHGKADRRVSPSQAKKMLRALEKANVEAESMFLSWGVHGLPEEKDRKKFYMEILSYFDHHLKPAGKPGGN